MGLENMPTSPSGEVPERSRLFVFHMPMFYHRLFRNNAIANLSNCTRRPELYYHL